MNRPRGAEGAVAGGKRLARARRRASMAATPARATAAVLYRLHQVVEADGRLRSIIVEVEDARVAAGEVPRRSTSASAPAANGSAGAANLRSPPDARISIAADGCGAGAALQ